MARPGKDLPDADGSASSTRPGASSILRVGVTGSIGAGKSTVASILADAGCLVIDADRLGHEILADDEEVRALLMAELGNGVVDSEGRLDRRAIAAVVFEDDAKLGVLNGILHPRIRAREQARIETWADDVGAGIAVTEAALLVETGGYRRYDRLVVVVAPTDVRLDRLVDRGLERDAAARRDASQAPQEAKVAVADYVIDNGRSHDATRRQVDRLHHGLTTDLERRRAGLPLRPLKARTLAADDTEPPAGGRN